MENTNPLTRRQFIGQNAATIALAAAPLALPGLMRAQSDTPAKRLRIGIAGGRFGVMFYWHEHPGCTVAGVTDLIPQRRENLMKVYGCAKSYRSLEEMVKDPSLEAIGVFTDGGPWIPRVPVDSRGTHRFHGYPWIPWVPTESMGAHGLHGRP